MKADWFVFIHMKVILGDGWEDPDVHRIAKIFVFQHLKWVQTLFNMHLLTK